MEQDIQHRFYILRCSRIQVSEMIGIGITDRLTESAVVMVTVRVCVWRLNLKCADKCPRDETEE